MPLCSKWMPRGDGLEMRSVISTAALSLHYLHLYKFSRCFGGYDYLSGSAREAILIALSISTSTTSTPAVPAISSENHIHDNSSKIPMVHAYLQTSSIISIQSHSITFWLWFLLLFRKAHLFGDQIATHRLKLLYLPRMFYSRFYFCVTLVYVFCVLHAYSRHVLYS